MKLNTYENRFFFIYCITATKRNVGKGYSLTLLEDAQVNLVTRSSFTFSIPGPHTSEYVTVLPSILYFFIYLVCSFSGGK